MKSGAFKPEIWQAAQKIARAYHVVLNTEDGEWFGRELDLPNVFGDGATAEACVELTREALATAVGYLLEVGKTPPPAAQPD